MGVIVPTERLKRRVVTLWAACLRRLPRVVSYDTLTKATCQLPAVQRQNEARRQALELLTERHRQERIYHRQAIIERDEVKLLLGTVSPETLAAWKASKTPAYATGLLSRPLAVAKRVAAVRPMPLPG